MTGLTRSSADLDPRRRRILYRCWHRGIREMDLVFGEFAENEIGSLSDSELDELEAIMAEEDQDLNRWITGADPVPEHLPQAMFARLAAYRPDFDIVTVEALEAKHGRSE
jgi:antitoxin CptB